MFFKIVACGVAFVSNVGEFGAGSTSVEREATQQGVYLTDYQLVKQRIGAIPCVSSRRSPIWDSNRLKRFKIGCIATEDLKYFTTSFVSLFLKKNWHGHLPPQPHKQTLQHTPSHQPQQYLESIDYISVTWPL